MKTTFCPLHDHVLIKRNANSETSTKGGLIIPDTAKEKPLVGKVIAVGPGKRDGHGKRQALGVKSGDKVIFGKYSGTEIKIDNVDYLVVRESGIFGVLE